MALSPSKWLSCLCLAFALLDAADAASVEFDYENQSDWLTLAGSFCGGSRQSPINIVSGDVQVDEQLSQLDFSQGWDSSRTGSIQNADNSVRFTPSASGEAAITSTPAGAYSVLQFHIHWGRVNTEGSEHRVDGRAFAGEMHFVHEKQPATAAGAGDQNAVVGVLLEADDTLAISGSPWEALMVPLVFNQEFDNVSAIAYSDFLPSDRSYYYYNGSLTTPLCNEVIQWFLLKQPVKIPSAFIEQLRMVQNEDGSLLEFNFREIQLPQGRIVKTAGASAASAVSILLTTMISLFTFAFV